METETIRGSHPLMRAILEVAERIATTDVCVVILGEKGTGKEVLARYIHALSPRSARPFLRIDCQEALAAGGAAILSGALAQGVIGNGMAHALLERARGGTLYLDRISALTAELQRPLRSALLADAGATADVRLLAGRDGAEPPPRWLEEVGLVPVELPVPALRQRRSDIPVLVEHFLDLYARRHGVWPRRIETEAMVQLWQYDWPGNVRELETVVERVVVLSRSGVIRAADLPRHICGVAAGDPAGNGCSAGSTRR
jgi:DNA-binding NtrC family response regulator